MKVQKGVGRSQLLGAPTFSLGLFFKNSITTLTADYQRPGPNQVTPIATALLTGHCTSP